MATLASITAGAWTIRGLPWTSTPQIQPFYNVQASGENLISKDEKVIVRLESPYVLQDYFLAGPDINDNYYISDACGIMMQPKQGCCGH